MPRGTIVKYQDKLDAVAAINSGSVTLPAAAKKLGVAPDTVTKWVNGKDLGSPDGRKRGKNKAAAALSNGHAAELAQREAIAYLRHARDEINAELRDGRIKKLNQSHLLALLALEALGGS